MYNYSNNSSTLSCICLYCFWVILGQSFTMWLTISLFWWYAHCVAFATVDTVGKAVHWDLSHRCEFNSGGKWFEHNPEDVLENSKAKILWDFAIQIDWKLANKRPDIVVIDKKSNNASSLTLLAPLMTWFAWRSLRKRRNILAWPKLLKAWL